jgi:integrase
MGIKKLSNGTYEVSFCARHPISRVPKSLKRTRNDKGQLITSSAEAKRIYNQLVKEVNEKLKESVTPVWRVMVARFVESSLQRGLMTKTVENYRLGLEAHTFDVWGHRKVDSIQTEEIRRLILDRLSHRSPNQQKNVLKFIRAVFTYAVETGAIVRNPTPNMKFRIGDKIKGVLTEKQIEILLNQAKELDCEWYPHWAMALYTGMRSGELYALTWDRVNLEERKILVDCSWNNVDGFKATKSGDDRIVEIAPDLIPVMAELKLKNGDSNFVLPRLQKWDKGEQARELRMFLMGLGLPAIRFHDLRASWATVMLGKGVEPIKVMIMGGWKDMKTMMIYMRKAGVDIKGITDVLRLHNPSRDAAKVIQFGQRS